MSGSSILLAAAVAAALLVASASAQSGCTAVLVGLYPCMNYIGGNDMAPTKSCCSQLGSVVQSQPQCLCSALGGDSSSLGRHADHARGADTGRVWIQDDPVGVPAGERRLVTPWPGWAGARPRGCCGLRRVVSEHLGRWTEAAAGWRLGNSFPLLRIFSWCSW